MQDMMKKLGKGGGMPPGLGDLLGGGGMGGMGGRGASLGGRGGARAASPVAGRGFPGLPGGPSPLTPGSAAGSRTEKALATRGGHLLCFSPLSPLPDARRQFPLAVTLRLKRFGRLNHPTYRVVATDPRFPRDGRIIEALGYYLPLMPRAQEQCKLNTERDPVLAVGRRQAVGDGRGQMIEKSGLTVPVPKQAERQKSKGKPAAVRAAEEEGAQAEGAASRREGCARCRRPRRSEPACRPGACPAAFVRLAPPCSR
jgi:small subunit ribosomal protein S16